VFNLVATYNVFESGFAEFLDRCSDVTKFSALAEHFTIFTVEYLKLSGALGHYYPDWVVVQKATAGPVNWIIETKGRVWPDTGNKDAAVARWCEKVAEASGEEWKYVRVNQVDFAREGAGAKSFSDFISKLPKVDQPKLRLIKGDREATPPNAIPLLSLEAAAGHFGSGRTVEREGWIEVDFGVKEGMFAARIIGHSMEPNIPDGSIAVFLPYIGGTRENLVVLAELLDAADPETAGAYTIKRYSAEHGVDEEGREIRRAITLKSDNPEVESIPLTSDEDVRVVAIFDRVLGSE
jgi:SOS-response transcriptional repressor LexA